MIKLYLIFEFFLQELKILFKKIIRLRQVFLTYFNLYQFYNFFLSRYNRISFKDSIINIFLKKNEGLWIRNKKKKFLKPKILVTSFVHAHPAYPYVNGIIGKYLSEYFSYELLGYCDENDFLSYKILRSFGIKKNFKLKEKNIFLKFYYFLKAIYFLRNINQVNNLLKIKYLGIDIGKITFDDVIRRTGNPTIDKINFKLVYHFSKSILIADQFKKLISKTNIKAIVQSETQFIPSAIIFQIALKKGIKVYSRSGVTKFSVKVYNNFNERYTAREEFSSRIFKRVLKNYKNASAKGTQILKKRFCGTSSFENLRDSKWAHANKNNYSKEKLCKKLNWNVKKPIILIFCHSLIDGNFTTGKRVFRDNLEWLRYTLKSSLNIKSFNWLVKPHPMDWEYKLFGTNTFIEFEKITQGSKYIKLCPRDLSSYSITKIVNSIVTSHGSSAMEYSGFGVPSISAGEASYTKFNINYRAKNLSQYQNFLGKAGFLKKPSQSKQHRARAFTFIQNDVLANSNILVPDYDYTKKVNTNKFYSDCIKLIDKYDNKRDKFKKIIFKQLNQKLDHTIDLV